MANFDSPERLADLEGHSFGIRGEFTPTHDDAHRSDGQQLTSDGGLSVLSSDLLGFSWTTPINYTFDGSGFGYSSFDGYYRDQFESAMETWSDVADITYRETIAEEADWLIVWDPSSDGRGGVLGTAFFIDVGQDGKMVSGTDSVIIVMDPADTDFFFTTAIHEAGHGLGLAHIDHTSSIMSTFLNPSLSTITDYDTDVIQSLYGVASAPAPTTSPGNEGPDKLLGSSGADTLSGGDGSDTISGLAGNDVLYGNKNTDLIDGGDGADTIFGGQNDGVPSGTPLAQRDGADTISGGDGSDILYGNYGGDLIFGGSGADTIFGGQDSDTISGGAGYDDLYGNLGSDIFSFDNSNEGWDYILGYEAGDTIQLTGGVSVSSTSVDAGGDTNIFLSSGTRIELIGVSDSSSVQFEVL